MTLIENGVSALSRAIEEGMSQNPKRIPGWVFYDETGDKLFQAIMNVPEYYVSRCEYEILEANKDTLLEYFHADDSPFNLIELGAGDASKTEVLLKHFVERNTRFVYTPVDVSATVLNSLKTRLSTTIPDLSVYPVNDSYQHALKEVANTNYRKVFVFLGANIGNFAVPEATRLLATIAGRMSSGDFLLVGFDLKKDPRLIQAAYDDPHGVTREFNLNLLRRLNRELGANFDLDFFSHYPCYDPQLGANKSYLVSKKDQDIDFKVPGYRVHFNQWEVIHTEVSQKYDKGMIEKMSQEANLKVETHLFDSRRFFSDVVFTTDKAKGN